MIFQAICSSFKREMLQGGHDFSADVFKLALFKPTFDILGTYGAATTNYAQMISDELIGAGYIAGGNTLVGNVAGLAGNAAIVDFADTVFSAATFVTRGAMIYNSSKSDAAVAIWDFGADRRVTLGDFTVQMPPATADMALLRFN